MGCRPALTVNKREVKVPAEGLRGSRFDRQLAVYFDSDETINNSNLDSATATGSPLIVLNEEALYSLTVDELKGRILLLDYSLIDRVTNTATSDGRQVLVIAELGILHARNNGAKNLEFLNTIAHYASAR